MLGSLLAAFIGMSGYAKLGWCEGKLSILSETRGACSLRSASPSWGFSWPDCQVERGVQGRQRHLCLCQHWEGEQEPRWGWTTPGLAPERLQAWKACSTFMKRRRALSNAKKNHFNTIQIAWENLCPLAVLEIQVWKYYYLCQSSGIRGLNLGIKIQQITCILVDTFKPTTWSFRIYLRSFPPVEVMTFI